MLWLHSVLMPAFLDFRPGGDERDRTADPLLARQVLSQLSYAPSTVCSLQSAGFGGNCCYLIPACRILFYGGPKWT